MSISLYTTSALMFKSRASDMEPITLVPLNMCTTIVLMVAIGLGMYCFYQLFFHPLANIPGPRMAATTNVWKAYHTYRLQLHHVLVELHLRHGPVVRIGPNSVHVQDSQAVMDIYKGGRAFPKTEFYSAFQTFNHNLFGTQDDDAHALRRRQLAHGFSQKSVVEMEDVLDAQLSIFCDRLETFAASGEVFDLKDCISRYVLDVLGEIAFSCSFNAQTPGAGSFEDIPSAINGHILMSCIIGELPLQSLSKLLLAWSPIRWMRDLVKSRMLLKETCATCVRARISGSRQRKDLLQSLITAKDPETGAGLTEVDVNTEAFAMLVAGSHTTAGTLTLFFANVLRQPDIMERLEEELGTCLGHPPRGRQTHQIDGLENASPYLQACISENFRMHPVFTMPLWRRVTSESGLRIGEIVVPPNTHVAASNYVQHHNPNIWGPDQDLFKPERWLKVDGTSDRHRLLIPFSVGHRMCIGRNLAMTNILKTLTTVITRFDVRLESGQTMEPVRLQSSGIGEMEGSLLCTVQSKMKSG